MVPGRARDTSTFARARIRGTGKVVLRRCGLSIQADLPGVATNRTGTQRVALADGGAPVVPTNPVRVDLVEDSRPHR
jgi:hypothetical protein